jgi:hypothetical protein
MAPCHTQQRNFSNNPKSCVFVSPKYAPLPPLPLWARTVAGRDTTENVHIFHGVHSNSWAHAASYTVGTWGFSPGVKRPGREADQQFTGLIRLLYSPEVKNAWRYISILHAYSWHRDNCTLLTLPLSCKYMPHSTLNWPRPLPSKITIYEYSASSHFTLCYLCCWNTVVK